MYVRALRLTLATIVMTSFAPASAQEHNSHQHHQAGGISMPGMTMSGMSMSGMKPPQPAPPPPGPILSLDAIVRSPNPVVEGSPGQVALIFDHPLTLASLTLANSVGQEIPTRSTLPTGPVEAVRFPIVIPLAPGGYSVAWRSDESTPDTRGVVHFNIEDDNASARLQAGGHQH